MSRLLAICLVSASILLSDPAFALSMKPLAATSDDGVVVKVLCNPGSKNCIKSDSQRAKITAGAQKVINDPAGSEGECKGGGRCGNNSGGSPAMRKSGGESETSSAPTHSGRK
jgi:hypothetical protein